MTKYIILKIIFKKELTTADKLMIIHELKHNFDNIKDVATFE